MGIILSEKDISLLSEFSDTKFDLVESLERAHEVLLNVKDRDERNDCVFDSEKWKFFHEHTTTSLTIDYKETFEIILFHAKELKKAEKIVFINVVKSWVANLLDNLDNYSVHKYHRYLTRFIQISQFFNRDIEEVIDELYIINSKHKHTAFIMCIGVLNFLDFYDEVDNQHEYREALVRVKEEIGSQYKNVRILPKPRDVFLFSEIIDKYFDRLSRDSNEYIYHFSIFLWWNLTNLIPLRPFEFCGISRNGLVIKGNNYYLKLPRSDIKGNKKRSNKDRIQIIDTIRIPLELAKEIENYIKITEKMGETKTLISHAAFRKAYSQIKAEFPTELKLDITKFTVSNLNTAIKRFYREVVVKEFGYSVRPQESYINQNDNIKILNDTVYDITDMIKPGDTRHFAFINLMRLGYNPVEIARLGGHTKLNTQYHYHKHQDEFFLNVEVLKLMKRFSLEKQDFNNNSEGKLIITSKSAITENFGLSELIKDRFVRTIPKDIEVKKKLEMGFCIDSMQRCLVHDCPLCDYWRISSVEYRVKKSKIIAKVESAFDNVKDILTTIKNIHKYIIESYENELDEFNLELNKDLASLSKKLDDELFKYSDLQTIERKVVGEDPN